ncbi:peptidoglycan-binding protein [Bartonella australis AUST/NH1]|uniref:Peptidoglycan-binding protein n=1 Tax=Bartonella australis (strain Aust/NH1) TaxID=1094489 RepID=M1PCC2_BARAA|nr:peptidoglycan-binding domain-containing protein [Bartonella australis]AGF74266.1 peptidoglycan-binding protein [Bartonella australis AUST/NH1]
MAKKRKTRKTKVARQRSFIIAFFLISSHFFFWLVKWLYQRTRANALLVVGFFLFIISFGVVTLNALFLQRNMHQNVFIQMESLPFSALVKSSAILKKPANFPEDIRVIPIPVLNSLRKNSSSHPLRNSLSQNLPEMKEKPTKLGFYDGALGRINSPETRRAVPLREQRTAHGTSSAQRSILPKYSTDEIALLIKRSEENIANDKIITDSPTHPEKVILSLSTADITRVQEALRIFGNQEVVVTAVEDKETESALKQFQKMFNLPITGKISRGVLVKMREVGLLS